MPKTDDDNTTRASETRDPGKEFIAEWISSMIDAMSDDR